MPKEIQEGETYGRQMNVIKAYEYSLRRLGEFIIILGHRAREAEGNDEPNRYKRV